VCWEGWLKKIGGGHLKAVRGKDTTLGLEKEAEGITKIPGKRETNNNKRRRKRNIG